MLILYFTYACERIYYRYLSNDKPHAMTFTSGGRFIGNIISGLNIPLLPISIHFSRPLWKQNISILGSVYGLYAGLN